MLNYNLKASSTNDPRTNLELAKDHLKRLQSQIKFMEDAIRAGSYSEYFDLVEQPTTLFVPKILWEQALGEEWIKANQQPQNKSLKVVAKR